MPLRYIIRYFANSEKLVQKMAESYPIRRAAQLVVAVFYRNQHKISNINLERVRSFFTRFSQNVRQEIDDAKKQIKK